MKLPILSRYDAIGKVDDRLKQAYQLTLRLDPSIDGQIWKLFDNKGDLTVYWNAKPTRYMEKAVETAWVRAGELGVNVEHEWPGMPPTL